MSADLLGSGPEQAAALEWSARYFRAHYARVLPPAKDARLLDLGCGYGKYLVALAALGYTNCHGIDLSAAQVGHGARVLGLANIERANALDWLGGKEATFDCILAFDVLEHLERDELVALGGKIRQALTPGGTLIVQVPNGMAPLNPIGWGDVTHVRAFTAESIRQFFVLVGLEPRGCYELPPHMHGPASAVRRALWTLVLRPALAGLMLVANGAALGGIFTANLMAIATRPTEPTAG
ncbi:MAG: class I SAM-dependent methyltransferase [Candidatus Rokubacteria bacterium]|nr:class I SAM-dependent methyltransferase [Candidatus Rokubacteria bacterium]